MKTNCFKTASSVPPVTIIKAIRFRLCVVVHLRHMRGMQQWTLCHLLLSLSAQVFAKLLLHELPSLVRKAINATQKPQQIRNRTCFIPATRLSFHEDSLQLNCSMLLRVVPYQVLKVELLVEPRNLLAAQHGSAPENHRESESNSATKPLLWLKTPKQLLLGKNNYEKL